MQKKHLLVSIFSDPEGYPPTLNALEQLAPLYDSIFVLSRVHPQRKWVYPKNVQVIPVEKNLAEKDLIYQSKAAKILHFIKYLFLFWKLLLRYRPTTVLMYDGIPLYAFHLIKSLVWQKPFLWYHNHDVYERDGLKGFSFTKLAADNEIAAFEDIDLFTLPSKDRLQYFPIKKLKGSYILLPNYPALAFYKKFKSFNYQPNTPIKMIYQGRISAAHGLEEIIDWIKKGSSGIEVELTIIGPANADYFDKLSKLIDESGKKEVIHLKNPVNYSQLPHITAQHHIGIAINKPTGIIYQTGGTASNKIYEYMALGLPILYFDNPHYNQYLEKYGWTYPTNLSADSLEDTVKKIQLSYRTTSAAANQDFEERINFEAGFQKVIRLLKEQPSLVK